MLRPPQPPLWINHCCNVWDFAQQHASQHVQLFIQRLLESLALSACTKSKVLCTRLGDNRDNC
jgi:hypothetical protein